MKSPRTFQAGPLAPVLAAALWTPSLRAAAPQPRPIADPPAAQSSNDGEGHPDHAARRPSPLDARYVVDALLPDPAESGARYLARNPAQRSMAWFGPHGLRLQPISSSWSWGLSLRAVGRPGDLYAPAPPTIQSCGTRVEYHRGDVIEWYENDARGLEQGFTLLKKPPSSSPPQRRFRAPLVPMPHRDPPVPNGISRPINPQTQVGRCTSRPPPLRIELRIHGPLTPRLADDGGAIEFLDAAGAHLLTYGGLVAFDAAGRVLPSSLHLEHDVLALHVDDAAATYPVVIDPLIAVQEAKLIPSDAEAGDLFGQAVALSGDTAVVGSYFDDGPGGGLQGSAYVFVRNGTSWSQQAHLLASDAAALDLMGYSVAIDADTAVVGALLDDDSAGADQGSAYVYVRSGAVWTQQDKLTASDAAAGDQFGYSAAVGGDTAVIGALLDDDSAGADQGAAYVFVRSGGNWTEQAKLIPSDATAGDELGVAVAISGDTAIVGTLLRDGPGGTDQGAAYVFVRSGAVWTEQATLLASDGAADDLFGWAVAVDGDTAVVGARGDDGPAGINQGSAYVFSRAGNLWTEQAKLTASDPAAGDVFGWSVALAGDKIVVGAYQDDGPAGNSQGSAYVFVGAGPIWTEQFKIIPSDAAAGDDFGWSVAISGDTIVVGARSDDGPAGVNQGSAYAHRLCCGGDADGSGVVDLADTALFVDALLTGPGTPEQLCASDTDGDGALDGSDVQRFVDELLAGAVCP